MDEWRSMKTVGQLRAESKIPTPKKADSVYKPIERADRSFNPLKIPKALVAALPFASKPKNAAKRRKPTLATKRAVVLEKDEKRLYTQLQQLNTLKNEKIKKKRQEMSLRFAEHLKKKKVRRSFLHPL